MSGGLSDLARLVINLNVPEEFVTWLGEQGLTAPEDIAMAAATEEQVEAKLLEASGITFPLLSHRVAVTKLWMQCRGRVDREAGVRSGRITQPAEDTLDSGITNDLTDLWVRRHNFKLGTTRLLSDTLFARRYKELNATPRRLTIILPENIRTSASVEKRGGRVSLTIDPGQLPTAQLLESEAVTGYDEVWGRIRADFTTMCLVTVSSPEFFPYQTCEWFLDSLRGWIFQRFKNVQAPLDFYKEAYNKTMQVFVEGVRTGNKSLKELTTETSAYQHFFTVYTPPGAPSGSGSSGHGHQVAPGATADVTKDLQSEINRLNAEMRERQSRHDRQLQSARSKAAARRPQPPPRREDYRDDRDDRRRSRTPVQRKGNGKGNGKGKRDNRNDGRRRGD